MLVARYTNNPANDIKRNYSCYMGDASYAFPELDQLEGEELEDFMNENDIVWHPEWGMYAQIHHSGLSCWTLESESEFGAILEAKMLHESKQIEWAGFGQATRGNLSLVAQVTENLFIFECDGATGE